MLGRTALLLTLVGLLFAVIACGGESAAPTPTPSLSPTPEPSPSPTSIAERPNVLEGAEVIGLKQAQQLPIPGDVALIIETGCLQCDGPTTGLIRVYTRADGSPVTDTLLDPTALGLDPRRLTTPKGVEEEDPYITGFAISEDASEIMVSICVRETCGSGGLDAWSPDSETAIFRSTDGGVTWERVGTVSIGGFVIELLGDGRAIVGTWDVDRGPLAYRTFPGLEKVSQPEPDAWPVFFRGGETIWRSAEGRTLLRPDGSTFLDFGPEAWTYRVSATVDPSVLAVAWNWKDRYYLSAIDGSGSLLSTYEYPLFALSTVDLGKGLAIGNAAIEPDLLRQPILEGASSYLPVIFNLTDGTLHPILDPFAQPDFPPGRNHVVAVMRGFFSRVVAPGSCLNLRAEPSVSASVLACAVNGVLLRGIGLRHAGETVEAEGVTWMHVLAPDGVEGWASTAFLES